MGGHTLHSSIYMRCAERQTQREGRETMVAGEGEEGVTANSRPVSLGGWKCPTIRLWQREHHTRVPESHPPHGKGLLSPWRVPGKETSQLPCSSLSPFSRPPWGHSCHGNGRQRHCSSSAWHANLLISVLDFTLGECTLPGGRGSVTGPIFDMGWGWHHFVSKA